MTQPNPGPATHLQDTILQCPAQADKLLVIHDGPQHPLRALLVVEVAHELQGWWQRRQGG